MKTLIVVRHAKSSWAELGMPDFDRPLNDRGQRDAPEMARRLKKRKIKIDRWISSPARRARKTAQLFAEVFDVDKKDIMLVDKLYHAPAAVFDEVIRELDDRHETIILFSHNPGITDFVNSLTAMRVDNMPTCGMFAVTSETNAWSGFPSAPKNFLFFDYPKKDADKD